MFDPGIAASHSRCKHLKVWVATLLLFFTLSDCTTAGDMGALAEGMHVETKQDVVLRLETLTVLETKVRNNSDLSTVWALHDVHLTFSTLKLNNACYAYKLHRTGPARLKIGISL